MANTISRCVRDDRRRSRPSRSRLLLALIAACGMAIGVVALIVWNEQDRPIREVEAAIKARRTSKAMQLVGRYLRDHPQDAKAQALRARILVEAGQLTEAIRLFQRVGASGQADLHAWAKAHLLRQEWTEALPVLQRILQLNPDDPDALHEITACRSFLGLYPQAFESAERMASLPGHEARAWVQIGTLHENLNNKKSAVEAWEQVLKYAPQAQGLQVPAEEFFAAYGHVLLDDGRPQQALTALQQSLQLRETAEARLDLGNALRQLGDEEGAVGAWKRAVEMARHLREARESLAEVALRSGRIEEARDWLEPLLASADLRSSSTYLMQRTCLALGDREAAQSWRTRTAELRKKEHVQAAVKHVLIESPDSFWSRAIRAYQFAEANNWHQADILANALLAESAGKEPFIRELAQAVRTRSSLPSLELLPINHF